MASRPQVPQQQQGGGGQCWGLVSLRYVCPAAREGAGVCWCLKAHVVPSLRKSRLPLRELTPPGISDHSF